MTFIPIYDKRNRENLDKLADNTKIAAYRLYQYCIDNRIQILIYETLRSQETQAAYVKKGASKTMRSYHLVGQALDFVFVDDKGTALWSINDYVQKIQVINYAKFLGFTWGGDWDNDGDWRDEAFLDSPHLQFNHNGYGTDTFGKLPAPNINFDVKKEGRDLNFTSSTLRKQYETRTMSKATSQLLDDAAVKILNHTSKLKDGKLADGDLAAIAIELAVKCAREHQ
ncbi:MAG: M15 family metallopeptidase [Lysinibacillus sp.]